MNTQKENIVNAYQTLILMITGAIAGLGGIILILKNTENIMMLIGILVLGLGAILFYAKNKKWVKNEKKFKNIIARFSIMDFLDADAETTISAKK